MKKLSLVAAPLAIVGLALVPAAAQDEKDHPPQMKAIGANMKILKSTLESKNQGEATAAATKVHEAFAETKKYWVAKNIQDGQEWSDTALAGAKMVSDGAGTGDWTKVSDGVSKLGGTCKTCHDAHRERLPDGTYKIK